MFDLNQAWTAISDVAWTLVVLLIAVAVLEVFLYLIFVRWRKSRMALPIMFLAPAVIGLLILYVYPLLWEFNVSFTKMSIRYFVDPGFLGLNTTKGSIFVGFQNYIDVFTKPVLPQTSFYQLFAQTIIWTAVNVFFHVVLGVLLALMLNRQIRGRTFYRALIILPWAIPAVASLQIWRTEYNFQYGAVNQILGVFGIAPIPWLSDPTWNFVAMIITNVWLGVPFMMVITLGALQSISEDYYEAADLDGASSIQRFWHVTWPQLAPITFFIGVMGIIAGMQGGFEMARVMTQGGPAGSTTTLSYFIYTEGFETGRLGYASAAAWVLFALVFALSLLNFRFGNRSLND